jgi:hypothetical protein
MVSENVFVGSKVLMVPTQQAGTHGNSIANLGTHRRAWQPAPLDRGTGQLAR